MSTSPTTQPTVRTGAANKYLTFLLGTEEYGLEILKVREIIGWMDITPVPRTPPYISGVINLRGQVIPVVDLRRKLRMPAIARTQLTCIVVVEIQGRSDRKLLIGVIVDQVSEVLSIAPDAIEEAPGFGTEVDTDFILGIAKVGKQVKILLDINKVLTATDHQELSEATAGADAASVTGTQAA
jgi:purine-binding chemotaxis protein CheW